MAICGDQNKDRCKIDSFAVFESFSFATTERQNSCSRMQSFNFFVRADKI